MTVEWLQQMLPDGVERFLGEEEQLPSLLFWTYLGVSIALVAMAGLMSGLTLGLMSLDELDLEVGLCLQLTRLFTSSRLLAWRLCLLGLVQGWQKLAGPASAARLSHRCCCCCSQ